MRFDADALAALAQAEHTTLAVGDVFLIPVGLAFYRESPDQRRALVVRIKRAANGDPARVHLVYGTTKSVREGSKLAIPKGEAGLAEATNFDFGAPPKEFTVSDLFKYCQPLGRLDAKYDDRLEAVLAASKLPFRNLPR